MDPAHPSTLAALVQPAAQDAVGAYQAVGLASDVASHQVSYSSSCMQARCGREGRQQVATWIPVEI